MKRIFWVAATVVTVFALSLNALAQPGGQGGQRAAGQGGQFGGAQGAPVQFGAQMGGQATTPQGLLGNAEVRTRLALTEAQITQITAMAEALRPQPGAGGAPQAGRAPGAQMTAEERATMVAQQRQRTTDMWTRINGILNAEQQTKFKEIYFQANNGLNAPALDDWMLAVVDLTPAQKEAIAKIVVDRAEATRAAGGVGGGAGGGQAGLTAEERQARQAETTARNARFTALITAALTPAQRTKAEQLTTGAAALREAIGIRTPGQGAPGQGAPGGGAPGAGAGQRGQGGAGGAGGGAPAGGAGAGQRGQGGAGGAGGGFTPGQGTGGNFQPGAAGGQRGQGGGGAAGAGARGGAGGGAGGGNRGGGAGGGN